MVIHVDLASDDLLGKGLRYVNDLFLDRFSCIFPLTFDIGLCLTDDLISFLTGLIEHDLVTAVRTFDCITYDLIGLSFRCCHLTFPFSLYRVSLSLRLLSLFILRLDFFLPLINDLLYRLEKKLFEYKEEYYEIGERDDYMLDIY